MARGQAQAATNQLNTTNAVAGQNATQASALENKLMPGYESMMDTGYLSPGEEQAATTNEMGATASPFESAKFQANNTAGATRNAAGQEANQDALALSEGQAAGQTAANLQEQKMQNQEAGMYGIAGQEAGNRQTEDAMYGLGPGTLGARAAGPSGDQAVLGYLNMATGQGGKG